MPSETTANCRRQATHQPHRYVRKGEALFCGGVPCDHENRCCLEHRVHVSPHRGCILR